MANIKSAIKQIKTSEKRRIQNRVHLSRSRTLVRQARATVTAGDVDQAQEAAKEAIQALDRAAQKGVIHPNNAARRKARLLKSLNALQKA